jgi:hypothetical protein
VAPRALSTGEPGQGQLPVEPLPVDADVEVPVDVLGEVLGELLVEVPFDWPVDWPGDFEPAVSGALVVVDGAPEESPPAVAAGLSVEEPVRLSLR